MFSNINNNNNDANLFEMCEFELNKSFEKWNNLHVKKTGVN
jgi:hypothetical protein